MGDDARAIADYDAALKIDPTRANTLYARGFARRRMGDKSGAEADIAAAIKLRPTIAEEMAKVGLK
jgi:Flp pilus assembly protein TadD